MAASSIGTNVQLEIVGGKTAIITIDLTERHGASSSGKSETVATTSGNQSVPGFPNMKIGLNVFVKK